jgi:hypothetical protein
MSHGSIIRRQSATFARAIQPLAGNPNPRGRTSTPRHAICRFPRPTQWGEGYATIKYEPNGIQIWAARLDPTNTTYGVPTALAMDPSNNVVVTGYAVTVKYDSNGVQLWISTSNGTAMAVDGGGNIYVAGFGTNFNTDKLNANGSNLWVVTYKDVGPTTAQAVLVDSQTNIYIAGNDTYMYVGASLPQDQLTVVKCDSNGNRLWAAGLPQDPDGRFVDIVGAALDSGGNCYVLANTYNYSPRITEFSENEAIVWGSSSPSDDGFSVGYSIVLDNLGDVLITGQNSDYTESQYGTYKLSTNGGVVWGSLYPADPTAINAAMAAIVDKANNVYITGYSYDTNSVSEIVTIKYDNNGNQIWLQSYGSPGGGDAAANAIAVDGHGNVYVAGYDTTAAGGTEMVLIKYAPVPTVTKQANGAFLLQEQGEPGEPFDIQATTNFTTWLDLGLTTADTNGNLQFLDTNAPLFNRRFYITKPQ